MSPPRATRSVRSVRPARPARPARADQRARLIGATGRVIGRDGYLAAKIQRIAAEAGVSCTTFYEHFPDKRAAFLAAHEQLGERLLARLRRERARARFGDATGVALAVLADVAARDPDALGLLVHESLLAGAASRTAREALLGRLGAVLEDAWSEAPPGTPRLALPARLLLGAAAWRLVASARSGRARGDALAAELSAWAAAYELPAGADAWRRLGAQAEDVPGVPPEQPAAMPRGRHRMPAPLAARVQRERLLFATAAVVAEQGYERTSVAAIVRAARVSRETFYEHFRCREDVFAATLKDTHETCLAETARGYLQASGVWAEQVWGALDALLAALERRPDHARAAIGEAYAIDRAGLRIDEFLRSFAVFVGGAREGTSRAGDGSLAMEPTVLAAVIEALRERLWQPGALRLRPLRGQLGFLTLAPALGPAAALAFAQDKLAAPQPRGHRTTALAAELLSSRNANVARKRKPPRGQRRGSVTPRGR